MDIRSKARVMSLLLFVSFSFFGIYIIMLFLLWLRVNFFFNNYFRWNRLFLDQLVILQNFQSGTMMVLAQAKLLGMTVKSSYSIMDHTLSLSLIIIYFSIPSDNWVFFFFWCIKIVPKRFSGIHLGGAITFL